MIERERERDSPLLLFESLTTLSVKGPWKLKRQVRTWFSNEVTDLSVASLSVRVDSPLLSDSGEMVFLFLLVIHSFHRERLLKEHHVLSPDKLHYSRKTQTPKSKMKKSRPWTEILSCLPTRDEKTNLTWATRMLTLVCVVFIEEEQKI
jgi:hypothetical protein